MKGFVDWNRNFFNQTKRFFDSKFGPIDNSEVFFYNQIKDEYKGKVVLEIGGTGRPLFQKSDIAEYIGLDIDKSFDFNEKYHKYFAQSCEDWNDSIAADMIFSKYLIEHVPDNHKTFSNIENWLVKGGKSVHIFPLGYHPFSIANRLVGNAIAKVLIPILRPGTEAITGYPAFYHLCNSFALEKLVKKSSLKYRVKYFFGAEDYFAFFFPFALSMYFFNRFCYAFNLNIFASNAVLTIEKPS